VAGDEARHAVLDQIGRADRTRAEAQVRHRHRAGLLRVVDEVALRRELGRLAEDLDRVLVGRHRAIGAESPEHGVLQSLRGVGTEARVPRQRQLREVVVDADGELTSRSPLPLAGEGLGERAAFALERHSRSPGLFRSREREKFVEHRLDHAGRELLARQAVTPADDAGHRARAVGRGLRQCGHHVLVERLAVGAGLLAAVEHGDGACRRRQRVEQRGRRERPEQPHLQHADLLAARHEMLDRLVHGLGAGAHEDDHALGVGGAGVVEQPVLPPGQLAETAHRVLHHLREGVVEGIGALARLEEHVRVLRGAAQHGVLRRQRTGAVCGDQVGVEHGAHGVGFDRDDLRHFVRGAEAVEEMDHRDAPGKRSRLRDHGHVLRLLRRIRRQQRAAGGSGRHDVGLVAEDRQCVGGDGARRDVQHEGRQFAGDLVEVGNHQQQALAGGEAGRQRAGGERAVQRAGGAGFGLHLDDGRHRTPQVGPCLRRPLVRPFTHRRRRRDRIDRDHLVGEVGHAGDGFVAVDG
jgi:hypothetical protein